MRVTVYGAGAIGGITGAALARAGHEVLLVDRDAAHVAAMNERGLTVEGDGAAIAAPARAVEPARLEGVLELVLLAVKSQDTPDALRSLTPRMTPTGCIVSLQNGLGEELIAQAVGADRTVGCLVNWAADWIGPGRIRHGGHGAFVLGELDGRITPRANELADVLSAVEPVAVTGNIWGYKWSKVVYGSLLFATALVDDHVYEIVGRSEAVERALVSLVAEGIAVADKVGIHLEPFDEFDPAWYRSAVAGDAGARARAVRAIADHYRGHAKSKTGVWRDLAVRRRRTEVGGLLGPLLDKGEAAGVPMPLTRRLVELIRDVEEGRRPMDWANLDPLVDLAGARG
jgi:2-dehydropantoate 2-reductase